MISNELQEYLSTYILLKGEELDTVNCQQRDELVDISVIKRTPRTRKVVARLTLGTSVDISNIDATPDLLHKAFKTPNGKKQFPLSNDVYEWVRAGWIIREIRLEKDERSVKAEQYRMGFVLFQQQTMLLDFNEKNKRNELLKLKEVWRGIKHENNVSNPELIHFEILSELGSKIDELLFEVNKFLQNKNNRIESINQTWRFNKQVQFMHFLIALYMVSSTEKHFDWKQIGATYYKKIGGSKEFDHYKKEFIAEAEHLIRYPIQLLGLVSLGTITPIFFAGEINGKKATYYYGSVHATTDLAVFTDSFQTHSDILWLVENRGVLTRMAYEEEFLQRTKSIVVGVDGQVRSGHRRFINQLSNCVNQIIIWTDVDHAGLLIGTELFETIKHSKANIKWVIPGLEIVSSYDVFEKEYLKAIETEKVEQEQQIGGVGLWKKWIIH